jgi:hypothetical protein
MMRERVFAQWMPEDRSKQVLRRWLDQDEKDQWIAEAEEARYQRRLEEQEETDQ